MQLSDECLSRMLYAFMRFIVYLKLDLRSLASSPELDQSGL